jgi:hypothetical protein
MNRKQRRAWMKANLPREGRVNGYSRYHADPVGMALLDRMAEAVELRSQADADDTSGGHSAAGNVGGAPNTDFAAITHYALPFGAQRSSGDGESGASGEAQGDGVGEPALDGPPADSVPTHSPNT